MTILNVVYASAPTTEVLIPTLEILSPNPRRLCAQYEDITATLETGQAVTFRAVAMDISLPGADGTGRQALQFSVDDMFGEAAAEVEAALEAGVEVPVIFRTFLASDLSAPASAPVRMTLAGGSFQGVLLQLQAAYYDTMATAWPRLRYTPDWAPGLRYIR
ncbi:DUF1833 family protein [Zobellella sp. DQSA1]|uniref:DUF1833 family protein n=1 Tax=Zobellella sp. DQSA1 TaxID=3342386 RepID=UPI0035C0812F